MMFVSVSRSLVLIILDLFGKTVFEIVSLKMPFLDHSQDVITEAASVTIFNSSYYIQALFFGWKWFGLLFVERYIALAAVLPLSLSLDLTWAVLKIEGSYGALRLCLSAVSGERSEIMKILQVHFPIVVEVVIATEVHSAP